MNKGLALFSVVVALSLLGCTVDPVEKLISEFEVFVKNSVEHTRQNEAGVTDNMEQGEALMKEFFRISAELDKYDDTITDAQRAKLRKLGESLGQL